MADKTIEYTSTGNGSKSYSAYAYDSCNNKDYGTWYWGGDDENKGQDYVLGTAGLTFTQSNGKFTLTGPTKGNAPNFNLVWKSPKVNNGGTTYTVAVVFNIKTSIVITEICFANNFPGNATVGSTTIGPSPNEGSTCTGKADTVTCTIPVASLKNVDGNLCKSCHMAVTIDGSMLWVKSASTSNSVTHTLSAVDGEEPSDDKKAITINYNVYVSELTSGYSSVTLGNSEVTVRVEIV